MDHFILRLRKLLEDDPARPRWIVSQCAPLPAFNMVFGCGAWATGSGVAQPDLPFGRQRHPVGPNAALGGQPELEAVAARHPSRG